jgi:hypothetical protein
MAAEKVVKDIRVKPPATWKIKHWWRASSLELASPVRPGRV